MIPVRLEMKNFLPYRSPDPVRFEGIHLACLTGANGAGKSSILDAITWALWGRARAKRDDDLVHLGQDDMYVQIDFEQEGNLYRVIRRRTRNKRVNASSLDLFIFREDGHPLAINESSISATENRIKEILRLDYETFVHSAFLQQGKADAFTTKRPAERKQILSEILGLEQWSVYEERAKEKLKQITTDLEIANLRLEEIEAELARRPQFIKDMEVAQEAYAEAEEALGVAQKRLEEVAHAPAELKHAQEQQAAHERRVRDHERDLQSLEGQIANHQQKIAAYETIISQREIIEAGYATLQKAREEQSELAQKLQEMSSLGEQCHMLERQLDARRAELENEKSRYQTSIIELERLLDPATDEQFEAIQIEIAKLEHTEKQRDSLQEQRSRLKQEQSTIVATREALKDEGQNLSDRITRLEAAAEAICPLCGQPLDETRRNDLIAELIIERDTKRNAYKDQTERLKLMQGEMSDIEAHIQEMGVTLRQLSAQRQQFGALQKQMQQAHDAQTRLEKERASFNETQRALENEDFAHDIRRQIAELEQKRQKIGYDHESHNANRATLAQYQAYESQQMKLQSAMDALPGEQAVLESARQRKERVCKFLAEERDALQQLEKEVEQLKILVQEEHARRMEMNQQLAIRNSSYERLVNAQQQLGALERQEERKKELASQRDAKLHEQELYRELRTAFGKNGVPAMIIETAIPELEVTANDLLSRMTDGRMHLRITTQRDNVTGGVRETLDIEIADELGTRNYEMYSGGEAFRINFAIRVALSKMLARRAGAHLRALFIDEGFGTQDEDGRNKLIEAINAIQEDFDLILVITHIDELRDSFPAHIVIDKTTDGSQVRVR